MENLAKSLFKYATLFQIGGFAYYSIEVIFRGLTDKTNTHWSMFVLGGVLFILLGLQNEFYSWEMSFWKQCLFGAIMVTMTELGVGSLINIKLGWNVWHYTLPLSFFNGQINLIFSVLWLFLSGIAIVVDDYLRHWLFNEEKPRYYWK